jgi:hypothetical protein
MFAPAPSGLDRLPAEARRYLHRNARILDARVDGAARLDRIERTR